MRESGEKTSGGGVIGSETRAQIWVNCLGTASGNASLKDLEIIEVSKPTEKIPTGSKRIENETLVFLRVDEPTTNANEEEEEEVVHARIDWHKKNPSGQCRPLLFIFFLLFKKNSGSVMTVDFFLLPSCSFFFRPTTTLTTDQHTKKNK